MTEPVPTPVQPVEKDDQGLQEDLRVLVRQSRERQHLIGRLTGTETRQPTSAGGAPKDEKPTD